MSLSPARIVALLLLTGLVLLAVYLGVTALQVVAAAERDDLPDQPAQAIIVLGAAQYDGRPSPVLASRLDHVVTLYEAGVAPVVVVTGGLRPGDVTEEATASAAYLHANGVPDEAIRREVQGRNTWTQLSASARFLADEGINDVVLVSDPLHAHRLALTAREVGLDARVSPTPTSVITGSARTRMAIRETVASASGRLLGFRRLTNLDARLRGR